MNVITTVVGIVYCDKMQKENKKIT